MIKYLMLLSCILLPIASSAQEHAKPIADFIEDMDQRVPQMLEDFSIPGAAVAFMINGKIVLQKGYGFSDIGKQIKIDMQTSFNIGSISKPVTAWGVMKLVNEGKIDLDTPVEQYLTRWRFPESDFDSEKVTVRRLLSHTAGISLPSVSAGLSHDSLPTIVEWLRGENEGLGPVEIILEPGSKWEYSGGGYGLLQLILEEVSGSRFEDYMQAEVINPLGMINSSFKIDEKIMDHSATPYDRYGGPTEFGVFTVQSAAGFQTTLEDFMRFAIASIPNHKDHPLINTVLPPETVRDMMEPAPNSAIGAWKYGLGYQSVHFQDSRVFIGHAGSNPGWQASFRIETATQTGFIVFTNGGAGDKLCNSMFCELMNLTAPGGEWRDCWPMKSIAREVHQIIEEEGRSEIARKYASLKKHNEADYDFSESQLNELGYHYIGKKEIDKALAVFKLNKELFPYSYNSYDSYGEALLANGAREEGVNNYKYSVQLNPENENGKRVLKSLGESTNDMHIRIPVEDLKLLEGEYLSTFGTDKMIQYAVNDGELHRMYANGESTRLIPLGKGDFVYMSRGIHVFFDTTDLNAIILRVPGEGNFKKVK